MTKISRLLSKVSRVSTRTFISLRRKFLLGTIITSKDPAYKKYDIGRFTYGTPEILSYYSNSKLKIGQFCSIAKDVKIFTGGNHKMNCVTTFPLRDVLYGEIEKSESKGDVVIGNDVWIGYGVTILSGVKIGDGAIIGAESVVSKDVEPYSVMVGNPAIMIKKRFDDETINELLKIRWWDWKIENIKKNKELLQGDIKIFIKTFSKEVKEK